MGMREDFTADWAFGITGAIENIVRENFPQDLRNWPLLQSFDFEAYELPNEYMAIVLRDKLSGIPAGEGVPKPFPYSDHPTLPPKVDEIELWQFYLRDKFDLRVEDAAFLIPVRDSGKSDPRAEFDLFSPEEQTFWRAQISYVVSRYKTHLQSLDESKPQQRVTTKAVDSNLADPEGPLITPDEFSDVTHVGETPVEIRDSLKRFKEDHPDPASVAFIMMQFGSTKAHEEIAAAIKDALAEHGITGIRADDKRYHDDLFYNVLTYMHGCRFGIAVFERIEEDRFNPNVSLEVGYLFAMRKPVCLLKDQTLKMLPADLVGRLYDPFDPQDPATTIPPLVSSWLSDKELT
jgi:hypothetical protein